MNIGMKSIAWKIHFILLLFSDFSLYCQQIPYKSVGLIDGMPQSSVVRMTQDKQGYMWFATQGGLCKYDGSKFYNFSMYDGIGSVFILNVEIDDKGQIWTASIDNGIACYNGNKFVQFNRKNGLLSDQIRIFKKTGSGDYFICSIDTGIIWVDQFMNQNTILTPEGKNATYARDIQELSNGNVLISWNKGILELEKNKNYKPRHFYESEVEIICLYIDKASNIWAGGNKSLLKFTPKGVTNFSGFLKEYTDVCDIIEDSANNIMYFATTDGLIIKNGEQMNWMSAENGLPMNDIRSIHRDSHGHLWLGTFGGGAVYFDNKGIDHFGSNTEIPAFGANTIIEDDSGKVWIATNNQGVVIANGTGTSKPKDLQLNNISNAIASTSNKAKTSIYFAQYEGNIVKIENEQITWRWIHNNQEPLRILSITHLKNNLVICTQQGLFFLNEKQNHLTRIEEFNDIYCTYSFVDDHGFLWVLADNGNIFRWKNGEITNYTEKINPKHANISHGMYSNKNKAYYFCSHAGLIIWNGTETYILHSKNGLHSDNPWSVVEDKNGDIWLGHSNGVDKVDLQNKKIFFYGYDQGFTPIETNACAAICDRNGNVWFGTVCTATRFRVDEMKPENSIINFWIQEIDVNDESYFVQDILQDSISSMILPYNRNNLSIDLVAITYDNAKDVEYAWFMSNYDNKWTHYSRQKKVIYSNLPPGNYEFMVKAKDPNGFETKTIRLQITIQNPIWNRWWFYLTEVTILIFIIYLSFRFSSDSSQNKLGSLLTLVSILIIFEAVLLTVSGYINKFTGGVPIFQLVMNVILAGTLHPLEQFIRKFMRRWALKRLRQKVVKLEDKID